MSAMLSTTLSWSSRQTPHLRAREPCADEPRSHAWLPTRGERTAIPRGCYGDGFYLVFRENTYGAATIQVAQGQGAIRPLRCRAPPNVRLGADNDAGNSARARIVVGARHSHAGEC